MIGTLNKGATEGGKGGSRFLHFPISVFCLSVLFFIGLNSSYYPDYMAYYEGLTIRGLEGIGEKYCQMQICCYDLSLSHLKNLEDD